MKAMVLVGRGRLDLQDIPIPELNPEGVIVRVEAVAICNSTDLRILDADDPTSVWPNQPWPFVMGHELCGRIVEVGSEVKGWQEGDRIAGWCPPYGGFAQFCQVYPNYMVAVRPPDDMPAEVAALLELSVGTTRYFMPEAVRNAVDGAEAVIVVGLGPSGLLYVRECALLGCKRIYATDTHENRRALAREFGACEVFAPCEEPLRLLGERGVQVDVAVDTTGRDILDDLLPLIRPGGALIPFGVGWDWAMGRDRLAAKGIVLSSASLDEGRLAAPMVMDWVSSGDLRVADIITRRIRLEELEMGFESLRKREDIKVVVEMR